jgi:hypothetical protein
MKYIQYMVMIFAGIVALAACEKKDYAAGVPEMEHQYYAIFVPNNNSNVIVQRTQAALLKFPVQFYSTATRSYDAVAKYAVVTTGIATPAVLGQDFNIVDKNGNTITPAADGSYTIVFPQAKQAMDTIYIKLLNNPTPGTRKMEINMLENQTSEFYVDIFSTAFRRPVEIR